MIELKSITKDEFDNLSIPELFPEERDSKKYSVISYGLNNMKMAWSSTLINPEITEIDHNIYAIGIDQCFALIDFKNNLILLKLSLMTNFYNTKIRERWIYVITELCILKINRFTYKISDEFDLPDIFEEIDFTNNQIKVKCMGNINIVL